MSPHAAQDRINDILRSNCNDNFGTLADGFAEAYASLEDEAFVLGSEISPVLALELPSGGILSFDSGLVCTALRTS